MSRPNLIRVITTIAILLAAILLYATMDAARRIDEISPAGRPLSEANPELWKQELKEHRDAQAEANKQGVHPD